ncbi:putative sulfoacetate--CoA ligase [Nymphon striatum]|nr:putative sulfoacetate--CoA ligase [Nymphon striatum]
MTYADLQQHCLGIAKMLNSVGLKKEDRVALLMPNGYWTAALFLGVMYSGRVIIPLNSVSGDTALHVVPTIIAYLIEHAEREGFDRGALGGLSKLRIGRSASAPLAPEMHKRFEEMFGVPIIETMGLSETAAQILSNPMPPQKPKYGSPGIAVGNEAKIIDEKGNDCDAGVEGELMIRGNNVTTGYYKNPQATSEALENDGWLHTGDVAVCDEDGFYFITGRIKELIIKGGENIAPREIDEALYDHPAVLEAAGLCNSRYTLWSGSNGLCGS